VSPFRVDRTRREEDRFLGQKLLVFVLGAVAGLAGMATSTDWLIYLAVLLLAVGLVLRAIDSRHREARRAAEIADDEDVRVEDARNHDAREEAARDEAARDHDLERNRGGLPPPGGSAD
jgi:hypothetical protein